MVHYTGSKDEPNIIRRALEVPLRLIGERGGLGTQRGAGEGASAAEGPGAERAGGQAGGPG